MRRAQHPSINTSEKLAKFYLEKSNDRKRFNYMEKERMKKIFIELRETCTDKTQDQIDEALLQL